MVGILAGRQSGDKADRAVGLIGAGSGNDLIAGFYRMVVHGDVDCPEHGLKAGIRRNNLRSGDIGDADSTRESAGNEKTEHT